MTLLRCAQTLAGHGLRVFPINRDRKPMIRWKDGASADPASVNRMPWRRAWIIGVPAERFLAVDVDPRSEGDLWLDANRHRLPTTRAHATGSGGVHLLFRPVEGARNTAGQIAAGVDTRASGGYINWWPAIGLPVEHQGVLADVPPWLRILLMPRQAPEPPSRGPIRHADRYVEGALRRAADTVAGAPEGQRNFTLNREAWCLSRLQIGEQAIRDALLPAALAAGLERQEAERTLVSGVRRRAAA